MNTEKLIGCMEKLHSVIEIHVALERERFRKAGEKGELPHFVKGDYVLVARKVFYEGQKLCLR